MTNKILVKNLSILMKIDYTTLSYLLRGKRRQIVFLALESKPKTPKQLAKECNISISNISVSLAELVRTGFVKCITPNEKFFRFYELTEKGKEAAKQLREYTGKTHN